MIVAGGLLIGLQGLWVDEVEEHTSENVGAYATLGGLALMGGGGVMIALADVQSPVVQPQYRRESGFGVFATRRGGGIARTITW